jgi:hypothetical protein
MIPFSHTGRKFADFFAHANISNGCISASFNRNPNTALWFSYANLLLSNSERRLSVITKQALFLKLLRVLNSVSPSYDLSRWSFILSFIGHSHRWLLKPDFSMAVFLKNLNKSRSVFKTVPVSVKYTALLEN